MTERSAGNAQHDPHSEIIREQSAILADWAEEAGFSPSEIDDVRADLLNALGCLTADLATAREALEQIAGKNNGFVFYNDLCEIDTVARTALAQLTDQRA